MRWPPSRRPGSATGGHELPLTEEERAQRREAKGRRRGLLLVFTGNGKGKSTAAFGLALRAAGNRMPVKVIQFIKGSWKTGEREVIKRALPEIDVEVGGRGFTIERRGQPSRWRAMRWQAAVTGWSSSTRSSARSRRAW